MIKVLLIFSRNFDTIGMFYQPKDVVPFSSFCPIYSIIASTYFHNVKSENQLFQEEIYNEQNAKLF